MKHTKLIAKIVANISSFDWQYCGHCRMSEAEMRPILTKLASYSWRYWIRLIKANDYLYNEGDGLKAFVSSLVDQIGNDLLRRAGYNYETITFTIN